VALFAFERRLPAATRHRGRVLARRAAQAAVAVVMTTLLVAAAATAALIQLIF
jgi:hypothetical protein